ncbi:MAG: hypothetical protein ACRCW4_13445 [Candidatus Neomicrothrix subdominans]
MADLAARSGLDLDPWQRHVLDVGLAEGPDGLFAALEVCLLVPRQNGKSGALAALAVAAPFLFDAELVIYSAHEFKTAKETFRLASRLVQQGPLRSLWKKNRESGVETGIEFKGGARIIFVARSRSSGRGFTGDLVILDEAFSLRQAQLGALLPTLSARPNPQVWLASSAPMADSDALHEIIGRVKSPEPGRLAFMEWSVEPGTPLDDRDGWAQANPALGRRLTERWIETELKMPPREFQRERLGIGDDPLGVDAAGGPIDMESWGALVDRESDFTGRMVLGVDVSPDRSQSSVSVAGARVGGGFMVEVLAQQPGTRWVPQFVAAVTTKSEAVGVAVDPGSAAGSLIPELEALGLTVVRMSPRDHAHACAALADRVPTGELFHRRQDGLDIAVEGGRKRTWGVEGLWMWDRARPEVDITPVVSVTLAFGALLGLEPEEDLFMASGGAIEW